VALRAIVGFAVFASLAPLQCPSTPRPERAREETPAEALWQLSERFGQQGDPGAQRATLTFLVERYPASRFAERARAALGADASAPR
jgi:hypothetical protein